MKIDLPSDRHLAAKVIDAQREQTTRQMERGAMGRLFGIATEKPGNIAGFAIVVFSLMFAGVLIWGTDTPSLPKKEALTTVGSFITLTLGFIFGRTTS